MSNLAEKEAKAIQRLQSFEPEDGYFLAYSGGKDGDVIKILANLACVKFEAVHSLTTADAPETINYIKSQPDVRIERHRYKDGTHKTMWNLIENKLTPPLRQSRYCCAELKEASGAGKVTITGVRWAESTRRKSHSDVVQMIGKPKTTQKLAEEIGADYAVTKQGGLIMNEDNAETRRMVELCYRTRKTIVNPIVEWADDDVWNFLRHYGCRSNPLYECGFRRVGCIGCPMAGKAMRKFEFDRYPTFKLAYTHAFDRMLERRKERGMQISNGRDTGEELFDWWVNG